MDTKISSSSEDYLEAIYELFQKQDKVRAVDIVNKFGFSRASVTEALQKLANKGYINYGRYQPIELTTSGKTVAKQVIEKHKMLFSFFKDVLGLSDEEASENACKIEHVISENLMKRLISFIEFSTSKKDTLEEFKKFYTK